MHVIHVLDRSQENIWMSARLASEPLLSHEHKALLNASEMQPFVGNATSSSKDMLMTLSTKPAKIPKATLESEVPNTSHPLSFNDPSRSHQQNLP